MLRYEILESTVASKWQIIRFVSYLGCCGSAPVWRQQSGLLVSPEKLVNVVAMPNGNPPKVNRRSGPRHLLTTPTHRWESVGAA